MLILLLCRVVLKITFSQNAGYVCCHFLYRFKCFFFCFFFKPSIKVSTIGCLNILATPKFRRLPKNYRVLNWPPSEMTKSKMCRPPPQKKMIEFGFAWGLQVLHLVISGADDFCKLILDYFLSINKSVRTLQTFA